ncbi:response regulator [Rhodocyclus gracilis]|uniref:response regulator n=1 Tax=Rhodocyclus gracilis TaxID=2929842 RepID=UPI001E65712F|nr:response regulator [Rhodocyclus gracilis]
MTASTTPQSVRILVIDDSATIRRSAELFLGEAGHEVLLADDGFAALAVIAEHSPDLIFCDITMPRLDGYQTCALIKSNPRYQATPVVMLTAKDSLFDRTRGRLCGASEHLTKPFSREALLACVDALASVPA